MMHLPAAPPSSSSAASRLRVFGYVATANVLVLAGAAFTLGAPTAHAAENATYSIASDIFDLSISNIASGWALAALGLNNTNSGQFAEIESELSSIDSELDLMESTLTELDSDIKQQTCDLEDYDTTNSARAEIDDLADDYQVFLLSGATSTQMQAWTTDVLDTANIGDDLTTINDALLSAGNSDGIIASCLDALANPTDGTLGTFDYYDDVANLTNFFYGYQIKGLLLIDEAKHFQAYKSWASTTSDTSSIDATDPSEVCTGATGNTEIYCSQATTWNELIYNNIQDQFAYAGAPYDVSGSSSMYVGSPYLFANSLEDYTTAQGNTAGCSYPLNSADPCGVTSGTNLQTFSSGITFAGRDDWSPATAAMLAAALENWSTSSENPGTYLNGLGFENMGSKIILTPDTYDASASTPSGNSPSGTFFTDVPAGCFMDTTIDLTHSKQPFCFNGSQNGVDYGTASALMSDSYWNDSTECWAPGAPPFAPSSASTDDYFYDATFESSVGLTQCKTAIGYWTNDVTPGWILKSGGYTYVQNLWPALDVSTLSCTDNKDGSARSATNPSGMYTMCGADFDAWLSAIVPSPYQEASGEAPEPEASETASPTPSVTATAASTTATATPPAVPTTDDAGSTTTTTPAGSGTTTGELARTGTPTFVALRLALALLLAGLGLALISRASSRT